MIFIQEKTAWNFREPWTIIGTIYHVLPGIGLYVNPREHSIDTFTTLTNSQMLFEVAYYTQK